MRLPEEEWFNIRPSTETDERMPCYDFIEKEAEKCRYCRSPELSSPTVCKHVLYGIIDNQPAKCILYRNHYKCLECGKTFFQSASDEDLNQETFTEVFINHVLEDWIAHREKTLRETSCEYFINTATVLKWERTLVDYFDDHFHAETKSSLVFSSFLDKDKERRGVIYSFDDDGNAFISAFLREYSLESIRKYVSALDIENRNKVKNIMFRYTCGLEEILQNNFLFADTRCTNLDSLYTMMCKSLSSLNENDQAIKRNQLQSILFSKRASMMERREGKRGLAEWLTEVEKSSGEDLSCYKPLSADEYHLLTDSRLFPELPEIIKKHVKNDSVKGYPDFIRELANNKASYDAIALKMYDTDDVRDQIAEAIRVAAKQHGVSTERNWNSTFFVEVISDSTKTAESVPFFMPEISGVSIKIS